MPGRLSGRVGEIGLSNIVIDLHQLGFYGPEAPTPEFDFEDVPTYEEEEP